MDVFGRRNFIRGTAACGGALAASGPLGFLAALRPVSGAELGAGPLPIDPGVEPLVRLLEEGERGRVLEEVAAKVRAGTSYRELLAALLLAGVRNIQPRPVGFKFHAVLVVNSAHLASVASPPEDRWLPIFWAVDQFKRSQARDVAEGDWRLGGVENRDVPPPDKAPAAFAEAMWNWDVEAADAAAAGLARGVAAHEVFALFCRYGARDFRDIGHKIIYVANSWRTLQVIGWHHAEPVLRSLAYALNYHGGGGNPAQRDDDADRPGRVNLERLREFRPSWAAGRTDGGLTAELLAASRGATADDFSAQVTAAINGGASPRPVWDALFCGAGEALARRPGIVPLHAVTSANALKYCFDHCGQDDVRRFLLLQASAFLPLFRRGPDSGVQLDHLQPLATEAPAGGDGALEEIFAAVGRDNAAASRKLLAYLGAHPDPSAFARSARRLLFLKGTNSHDYKFSSAALEDYEHISPGWRERYLAACVYNLRGSGGRDNELVGRIRAALG